MRQLSVIVLIALIAGSMAQMQNCSLLAVPSTNFYTVPAACKNTTAFATCETTYNTCKAAAATAGTCPVNCATAWLRCVEAAASTASTCDSAWTSAFNNERLYLAAGGDYNGSALMHSCNYAICYWMQMDGKNCSAGTEKTICADPSFGQTTQAPVPATTTAAPTAAPGRVVASFKLSGTPAEWQAVINKLGKAEVITKIVNPILKQLLGTSAFVVTNVAAGSLQIDFYMTDNSTPADVINKLENGTIDTNNAEVAAALAVAKSNGVASTIGVVAGSTSAVTQAPNPGTPPTTSASAAAVLAAVLAVVAAMLF